MDGYNSDSDTSLLSTQSDIDDIQFYENFDELDAHGWSYDAFSSRGADYVGNLRSRIGRENNFVLEYDATDQILFDKCKKEIIN